MNPILIYLIQQVIAIILEKIFKNTGLEQQLKTAIVKALWELAKKTPNSVDNAAIAKLAEKWGVPLD